MKRYAQVLTKAILAGILIGIAGIIYITLVSDYKIIGAVMFGFGLLVIVVQGYNLYTGKVGYIIDNKPGYIIDVGVMIVGNFIGTTLIALLVHLSKLTDLIDVTKVIVADKLSHPWYSTFGLSIICGMLMYLAVEGYRRITNDVARVVIVLFAVAIFILGRSEHSIADMFYFSMSLSWSLKAFAYFLVMLLGNGIGAILLNYLEKASKLKS